jgi:hypothetical protein
MLEKAPASTAAAAGRRKKTDQPDVLQHIQSTYCGLVLAVSHPHFDTSNSIYMAQAYRPGRHCGGPDCSCVMMRERAKGEGKRMRAALAATSPPLRPPEAFIGEVVPCSNISSQQRRQQWGGGRQKRTQRLGDLGLPRARNFGDLARGGAGELGAGRGRWRVGRKKKRKKKKHNAEKKRQPRRTGAPADAFLPFGVINGNCQISQHAVSEEEGRESIALLSFLCFLRRRMA